jgi:hypothetical protein
MTLSGWNGNTAKEWMTGWFAALAVRNAGDLRHDSPRDS